MKKRLFFLGMVALMFAACTQKNAYTLSGKLPERFENNTIYLLHQGMPIDSAVVINGVFKFEGVVDSTQIYFVNLGKEAHGRPSLFVVEPGELTLTFDEANNQVSIQGASLNNAYYTYQANLKKLFQEAQELDERRQAAKAANELTIESYKAFDEQYKTITENIENEVVVTIKNNSDNLLGEYLFLSDSYFLQGEQLGELLPMFSDALDVENLRRYETYIQAVKATAVGLPFTDVSGLNINGQEVKLSDYAGKGKVILVDFWASWCGPCRKAMPELLELYATHQGENFEIVGISLDDSEVDWKKATIDDNITWPQISNLKGWSEPAALTYGIRSIPQTVLIDPNGIIIGRNMELDAIHFKLMELAN